MSKPYGKPDRIVVALGGNALGNNPVEQIEAVSNTAHALLGLIEQGNEIIMAARAHWFEDEDGGEGQTAEGAEA